LVGWLWLYLLVRWQAIFYAGFSGGG